MSRRTNDALFRTNDFRTNDTFSDQWVVGPMDRRTNGLSDHRYGTDEIIITVFTGPLERTIILVLLIFII